MIRYARVSSHSLKTLPPRDVPYQCSVRGPPSYSSDGQIVKCGMKESQESENSATRRGFAQNYPARAWLASLSGRRDSSLRGNRNNEWRKVDTLRNEGPLTGLQAQGRLTGQYLLCAALKGIGVLPLDASDNNLLYSTRFQAKRP